MITETRHRKPQSQELEHRLLDFFAEYDSNGGEPIEVSFRDLLPELNNADRATHLIHTYPAKLVVHIPYFFLNNEFLSKKGDVVLDPFSGSGTVMLEALLAGRNAIGSDSNPLARLISRVKTTDFDLIKLRLCADSILDQSKTRSDKPYPNVINIDHWFLPSIQEQLNDLYHAVDSMTDGMYKDFFWVCFSNCVKKVSLADPRVSVPVRLRYDQYRADHPLWQKTKNRLDSLSSLDVKAKFENIIKENILRFSKIPPGAFGRLNARIVSDDARDYEDIPEGYVDLIITSPPYAGAQKYIRASSLNLGWLDLLDGRTLSEIEQTTIGRENHKASDYKLLKKTGITTADKLLEKIHEINPSRANIAATYLIEMKSAIKEMSRVLKSGGYLILVAANNDVCGKEFKTQEYLEHMVLSHGLKLKLRLIDHIKSRGLMTKRNKTASLITREWVMIFEK